MNSPFDFGAGTQVNSMLSSISRSLARSAAPCRFLCRRTMKNMTRPAKKRRLESDWLVDGNVEAVCDESMFGGRSGEKGVHEYGGAGQI